jgi:hypothetical protein
MVPSFRNTWLLKRGWGASFFSPRTGCFLIPPMVFFAEVYAIFDLIILLINYLYIRHLFSGLGRVPIFNRTVCMDYPIVYLLFILPVMLLIEPTL